MDDSSLISVIMPAYNAEKTIEAAICSVLAQTYKNFELIIIDDCSSDATAEIIEKYVNEKHSIRICRNDCNRGIAFSRNTGIESAKGEWVAFLDSDDMWRKDKLRKQMDFIRETGAVISYTASAFIDAAGHPCGYTLPAQYRMNYKDLLRHNLMSCSSVIVRRDIMLKTRMSDGMIHEDYAAWLQILRETTFAFGLNEPLLTYRVSKNSWSGNRLKSARMIFETYKYVGYGTMTAFFCTIRYARHSIGKRWRIWAKRMQPSTLAILILTIILLLHKLIV